MMNKMIVSNLTHRPLRSAISIVAVALEVTLILLIVGFSLGQLNSTRDRQAGIGADEHTAADDRGLSVRGVTHRESERPLQRQLRRIARGEAR